MSARHLICGILLAATSAFAHRPYERVAGTFQRADGTVISIVEHYVDGIVLADPVSIQFRLPDGVEVAHTPHIFDAIVRTTGSGVEIYQFATTWLPIASRVDLFDGYQLQEITSSRRASSLMAHFTGNWVRYLVVSGLTALFWALYCGLRALPNRGWRAALRALGFAFVGVVGFFLGYDILIFEPLSPLVLGGCGAIACMLIRIIRIKRNAPVG